MLPIAATAAVEVRIEPIASAASSKARGGRVERIGGMAERGDLGLGALQLALLVGRLEPRQELLVDVLVGIGVTLQLLQLHERLAVDQHLLF